MKDIAGFPGYAAGEDGRVYCQYNGYAKPMYEHVIKGYAHVIVRVSGKRLKRPVHRLVLLAFAGACPDGEIGRHLNGQALDNRPANLAWGTPADNAQDAVRHGTLGKGMLARHRKLTADDVVDIRNRVARGERSADIAARYGVNKDYPSHVASRRVWSHI
ncbi:HNH endonuclease signature motif containing protein [Cupriavidus metallidurans]|uniref:HNH endonuclease signature motif containing protein n=1 Tax=Cupriavidus metallidurans TaxID=119219 RepID=UPI000CE06F68|nr:HNH endonuclease signature motif containing protein [Cupriavidus metallidurans]AVA33352.1 hypothetical protein C3Z06_06750 [Cupriavidus metallidurans]